MLDINELIICGDGVESSGEDCDDGNTAPGDGCSASCMLECPLADLGPAVATGDTTGNWDVFDSPDCTPDGNAGDVSYQWVAPADGDYVFDTIGSALDTVLYMFDGLCDDDPSNKLACNNDAGGEGASLFQVTLTEGQLVTVVVDGRSGREGMFVLNIDRVSAACGDGFVDLDEECDDGRNDDGDGCSSTCTLECPTGDDLGSALGLVVAGGDTDGQYDGFDASCANDGQAGESTYLWTAPVAGDYIFTTDDTRFFDPVLYLLDGICDPAVESPIACDNDGGSGNNSQIEVGLAAGQTITVVVDGQSGDTGAFDDDSGGSQSGFSIALAAGQTVTIVVDGAGVAAGAFVLNVRAQSIFEDGFESGDTSSWSATVP